MRADGFKWTGLFVVALGGLMILMIGCASQSQLMPAPGVEQLTGDAESAVSLVEGVNVTLHTEAWRSEKEILTVITPLRITIENNSGQPVQVRYSDFKLVDSKGKVYAALPPYGITGSVEEPRLLQAYPIIEEPDFDYYDFYVAPYYAPIYPDLPIWDGPFYYDPFYYDQYYTYWQTIELPTERMLKLALPDGVIQNGGKVTGFIYFQEVSTDQPQVRFEYSLVNAKTGNVFGAITIPFVVKKVAASY